MEIIKERIKNKYNRDMFWNVNAVYPFADIMLGLKDAGLINEQVYFALHFYEPDVKLFYMNFKLDFDYIKRELGIPKEYIDRKYDVQTPKGYSNVKTNPKLLKLDKHEMKKAFAKVMNTFNKESKYWANEILKIADKAIKQGDISKTDIKPKNIEFKLDKMFADYSKKK